MFGYSKTTKADKSQAVPPLTRPEAAALIGTIGSTEKSGLRLLDHRRADPSSSSAHPRRAARLARIGLCTGIRAGAIATSSPACSVGFDGKPAASVKKGFQISVRAAGKACAAWPRRG